MYSKILYQYKPKKNYDTLKMYFSNIVVYEMHGSLQH